MKIWFHVFRHEVKKIFLDAKLICSMLLMPVVIVLLTSFLTAATDDTSNSVLERSKVYVLHNAFVPEFVSKEVELIPVDSQTLEELRGMVQLQSDDLVLDVTEHGATIYFNGTSSISQNCMRSCKKILTDHVLRDFAAVNSAPISNRISIVDVNPLHNSVVGYTNIIFPCILVLLIFQDVSSFAIDTIAGERERGVFCKTLLAPISPLPVIFGKALSSMICGMISSSIYIIVLLLLSFFPSLDTFGIQNVHITPIMLLLIGLCVLASSTLFAFLSTLCSLLAKNIKEAKSLRLFLYGMTIVFVMFSVMRSGSLSTIRYSIPIYNVCVIMQDILNSTVETSKLAVTIISLSGYSAITMIFGMMYGKKERAQYEF